MSKNTRIASSSWRLDTPEDLSKPYHPLPRDSSASPRTRCSLPQQTLCQAATTSFPHGERADGPSGLEGGGLQDLFCKWNDPFYQKLDSASDFNMSTLVECSLHNSLSIVDDALRTTITLSLSDHRLAANLPPIPTYSNVKGSTISTRSSSPMGDQRNGREGHIQAKITRKLVTYPFKSSSVLWKVGAHFSSPTPSASTTYPKELSEVDLHDSCHQYESGLGGDYVFVYSDAE